MSIDISSRNEARLKATAQAEGVSIDAYVERLLDEREELAAIVTRSAERMPNLSREEASAKIERGFLQSERGEVVDGDTFSSALLAELDELEHKHRTG
ncbi:MAG TPA: hypothetical protein VIX89_00095 [Bryobacteraceae bacterium]